MKVVNEVGIFLKTFLDSRNWIVLQDPNWEHYLGYQIIQLLDVIFHISHLSNI